MTDSFSGNEPALGGANRQGPTFADLQDANQCFKLALGYIERGRWRDARDSLSDALALVPGYPQADGLLSLLRDLLQADARGEPSGQQAAALHAFIAAMKAGAPEAPPADPLPPLQTAARGAASVPPLDIVRPAETAPGGPPAEHLLPPLSPLNPLDHAAVLYWFFMRPARLSLYHRAGQGDQVMRVAGWLTSTLLWLPLLLPALAMAAGPIPTAEGRSFYFIVAALAALWAVGGWLLTHDAAPAALMLASAASMGVVLLTLSAAGLSTGILVGLGFLVQAGVAAALAGQEANAAAKHLALGATFVVGSGVTYRTFVFIAPLVNAYVEDFILGSVGGPFLILFAVAGAGLLAIGVTYVIPFIAGYLASFVVEAALEEGLTTGIALLGATTLAGILVLNALLAWVTLLGGWRLLAGG